MNFSIRTNTNGEREIKCEGFNEGKQNWETCYLDLDHVNADDSMSDEDILVLVEDWVEETRHEEE